MAGGGLWDLSEGLPNLHYHKSHPWLHSITTSVNKFFPKIQLLLYLWSHKANWQHHLTIIHNLFSCLSVCVCVCVCVCMRAYVHWIPPPTFLLGLGVQGSTTIYFKIGPPLSYLIKVLSTLHTKDGSTHVWNGFKTSALHPALALHLVSFQQVPPETIRRIIFKLEPETIRRVSFKGFRLI